jgi:hypothetical protein
MKTVKLYPKAAFQTLPKELRSETYKKYGARLKMGTRDVARSLSDAEERKYLPDIIGVSPLDPNWNKAVRNFWCELTLRVTEEGEVLNIGLNEKGEPLNVVDYCIWKLALTDDTVAKTPDELENKESYEFYLIDPQESKRKTIAEQEVRDRATAEYLSIKAGKDASLVKHILTLFGDPHQSGMDLDDKLMELRNKAENEPKQFLEIVKDPLIKPKAIIIKGVSVGVLTIEGDKAFFGESNIGSYPDGAAKFINSQENIGLMNKIVEHIKEKTK